MEDNTPTYYHLLGDSGYGCRSYLLTPILEPSTESERRYNYAHVLARNTVERQYGLWKRRFPCLSVGLRTDMENTMTIIIATAVLHNLAIAWGHTLDDDLHYNDLHEVICQHGRLSEQSIGIAKRNAVIANFFSRVML